MGCDRWRIRGKPDFEGHRPIRHDTGIVDRGAQRLEVAKTKSLVDSLEPPYLVHRSASVSMVRPTFISFSSFGGYFVC
jgi:hypothetical protein